jgi:hypothetical protein
LYEGDYDILPSQWPFSHEYPTISKAPGLHLHQACPSSIASKSQYRKFAKDGLKGKMTTAKGQASPVNLHQVGFLVYFLRNQCQG